MMSRITLSLEKYAAEGGRLGTGHTAEQVAVQGGQAQAGEIGTSGSAAV